MSLPNATGLLILKKDHLCTMFWTVPSGFIYLWLTPSTGDTSDDNFKFQDSKNKHHFTSNFL